MTLSDDPGRVPKQDDELTSRLETQDEISALRALELDLRDELNRLQVS